MTENDENSNRVFSHRFRELEVPTISVRYLRNRSIETGEISSTHQTILKKIFLTLVKACEESLRFLKKKISKKRLLSEKRKKLRCHLMT